MHRFPLIGVAALFSACVYAPEADGPIAVRSLVPAPATGHVSIAAVLPEAGADGLPPGALDALQDGLPVRLDLTLQPPLRPSLIQPDGLFDGAAPCDFGPVPATEISIPTGSYHMMLDVRMGTPDAHPANLLSCDYDPAFLTDEDAGTTWRLRGCFLPQSVSIPTAVLWVLNPLPASACGISD